MKVYVHDYTKAAEARTLLTKACQCANAQDKPLSPELRALLQQARDALDSYLDSDESLFEEDSEDVYNGFVKYNDIKHLIK